jgi:hypothetical protein
VSKDHTHQEWFVNGVHHRNPDEGPAILTPGSQTWMMEGRLHRPGGFPAVVTPTEQQWWVEGKRHRDGNQPAVMSFPHDPSKDMYYVHGKLHRTDGPAWIVKEGIHELDGGDGLRPPEPAYYFEGLLHREDGPAFKGVWYCHGKKHRDGDKPAFSADGLEEWYQHGNLHRDKNPAQIKREGGRTVEKWYQHGVLHRDDGPAVTFGTRRQWFSHGVLTMEIAADLGTGIESTKWYENGVLKRSQILPPSIVTPAGDTVFYTDLGVIGREDSREPAVITADGPRKWYLNGRLGREKGLPDVEYANGHQEWHDHFGNVVRTNPTWHGMVTVTRP